MASLERDSFKDQFIVYLFLTITFGLLGYAGLQPFLKGLWQVQFCAILKAYYGGRLTWHLTSSP